MRLPKLRTIPYLFTLLRNNYLLSPLQIALRERIGRTRPGRRTQDAPLIVVQCVEDYFYFGLFSKVAAGLREQGPLRVEQYSLRSLRLGSSLSLRRFIWNSIGNNLLSDWKWRRLYRAFADRTAYCAAGWIAPWTALRLWASAYRLWRSLDSADDLARLTIRGIWVGDLIIDSYIRFKPAPALNPADIYLLIVIRQGLKDLEKAFCYFGKNRPALLLTSYTTYIQHGIPARVAAHLGVKVLTFSNMQEWTTEITPVSPWQTRSGASYKQDFSALPGQAEKIEAAQRQMEARLRGEIDSATTYMKTSAYGQKNDIAVDLNAMPVIFLHDFTDSIHIYRWITFHDFWNWLCFTIDTLQAAGIAFAVKPHPNQTSDDTGALSVLRAKYRDLKFIPPGISNKQLVEAGMSCAVTVYGTVASEMAFMGIPTISSGDNPHISFDFCRTARSAAEYASLLVSHRDLGREPAHMRRESCMFYHMHNLNLDQDQQTLRNEMLEFRRKLFFVSNTPLLPDIISAIEKFGSTPVFDSFYANLYRELDGSHQTRDHSVTMPQSNEPAPIALFAYQRQDHLRATIQALLRNPEAPRSCLFVFSDGAKGEADGAKVAAVRDYLAGVTGFATVKIIASPRNKGLSASIIDGVSLVLQESDRVIVVEDDLVVSEHFLAYMNAGLNCYAQDEKVASVHGYLYPMDRSMPETFFLRGADCWGWATWRRAWAHFNPNGQTLLAQLKARKLTHAFDHEGAAPFTQMLAEQIQGRNDSWAVRWHACCFLAEMFTLYPGRSLVHNIGNDGSGTHGAMDEKGNFAVALDPLPVSVKRIPVCETSEARKAFAAYFRRRSKPGLCRSVRRLAGKILRSIPWVRHQLMLSADYKVVSLAAARRSKGDGWFRPQVAANQEAAYQKLLYGMHKGSPRVDLAVAAEAVDLVGLAMPSLLEIGCGSGYYSEILKTLAKCEVFYTGVDYSPAMIARAKKRYPGISFDVGDAASLQYGDASFDIAFNGVSLMHILDYEKAIAETARTARRAAIFHSVPVFADHPTTQLHKYAYGGPMVESVFNRDELLGLFERYNLKLVKSWRTIDYDVSAATGAPSHAETFLCEKGAKN